MVVRSGSKAVRSRPSKYLLVVSIISVASLLLSAQARQLCALEQSGALTGKPSDAMTMIPAGIAAWQSSGSVVFIPWYVSHMARACAELGQLDDAWRYINEAFKAIETTGERWCESDIHRTAGISRCWPPSRMSIKQKHILRMRWRSHESNGPSPGNCEPRRVSRGSGAIEASVTSQRAARTCLWLV
jgi:hypothetical protein